MPKRSSEQSSYSVDEMMEKLREGERAKRRSEDSELVTRPDGSQVVRVRRRRRRSKQPHKTKEVRKRRWGITVLVFMVVALVGLAATVLVLLARFNSKGYRDELKADIHAATGARAAISEMAVTPFGARAKSIKLTWSGAGIPKSLKLNDLVADLEITSLLGAEWSGKEATARSGYLVLGPPDGTIAHTLSNGDLPFDYPGYRCANTEIVFGENPDKPVFRLTGAEMTLRSREEGGVQFLVKGGRANVGRWKDFKVDRGLAELSDGKFNLVSLRFSPVLGREGGEATMRSVEAARAHTPAMLQVELAEYPIHDLLGIGTGLGRMINGMVSTDEDAPGMVTIDPRLPDAGKVEIAVQGAAVTLQEFQFLNVLSDLLRKDFYARPAGRMSAVFRHDRDGIRLQEFVFDAGNDLKVEGNIDVTNQGELLGALVVGIPEALVMRNQTQKRVGFQAFSEPQAGYCRLKFELSGNTGRPRDSFGSKLQGSSPTSPSEEIRQPTREELLENEFDRFTRPRP